MHQTSIVIVTNKRSIHPPKHGAARRIWGIAQALSYHGFQVRIIETTSHGPAQSQKVGKIRILSCPIPFRKRQPPTSSAKMFPPLWELTTFGPQVNPAHIIHLLKLKINSLVDLVQIEFPYGLFEVIPLMCANTPLILDQHGVEVDFLREIHSSLGHSTNRLEALRVYCLERLAVRAASTVLCCSEHDRSRMNVLYGGPPSKYALVENGVDDEFFEAVSPFKYSSPTVLYLGTFSHSPNLYAIDWILKQVAPRVRRTIPNLKFVFVGSGRAPRIDGAMTIQDAVDVRPYIRGADVALATVFHGSGSRLKILEYLACGAPVVATTKGMEGLNLRPGEDLLVANDPESVAACITELITNKSLANRLASNGQRKTRSHYTWNAIISRALPIYLRNVA